MSSMVLPISPSLGLEYSPEQFLALVNRAGSGKDERALAEVRQVFDQHPALWNWMGNMALQVQAAWVERLTRGNPLANEAIERKLGEMRKELLGPSPTELDRLLVQRIIACWLQMQDADLRAAHLLTGDHSLEMSDAYQKRQERAQRRYLQAIKTLAQVRKLNAETIQINIAAAGGQQVNVGSLAAFFRGQAEQPGQ